jgi:hypothetical protein
MNKKRFSVDWDSTNQKMKEQEKGGYKDERIYYPQFNDDGTAQAVIRFLRQKEGDTDVPYVKVYVHSFRGPDGFYIDNCPTTINGKCPVCDANRKEANLAGGVWENVPEPVKDRKRRLSYYSNILVVNDVKNPKNNGKVFLYKYGVKIMEKIKEKLYAPEDSIIKAIKVFDYYEGANFNLIIKKIKVKNKMTPNYDSSNFESVSCVGTDEEIEKIHNSQFELKPFVSETNFKSYDDLKEKFNRVAEINETKQQSTETKTKVITETKTEKTEPKAQTVESKPEKVEVNEDDLFQGTDDSFFESLKSE